MKAQRSQSVRRIKVTTDGERLVSHAGIALLAEEADSSGLTEAMSGAMDDCGPSGYLAEAVHPVPAFLTSLGRCDGDPCGM